MPLKKRPAVKDQSKPRRAKLDLKPLTPEQNTQKRARAIVDAFNKYVELHDADFKQKAVNFAFLAGKTYYETVSEGASWEIRESKDAPRKDKKSLFLSFDKISDQYANVLGIFPEAIPQVGIVKRIDSPVNDSVSRTAQQTIDYHIEHEWKLKDALTTDIMPLTYPGGSCWAYVAPCYRGQRQAVKDAKGSVVPDMVVNEDGSVRYSGKTIPQSAVDKPQIGKDKLVAPAELAAKGYEIADVDEQVVMFEYVSLFNVAVYGKKKSAKDCIKLIYGTAMTISDLKSLFQGEEYKAQQTIIEEAAKGLTDVQDEAPQTTEDKYLSLVHINTERDVLLEGDDRYLYVWFEWHNPTSEYKDGRVSMVISNTDGNETMLWELGKLPWGLKRIPWAQVLIDGNPARSSIKKSPMEAMIGAQVGRDRLLNSKIKRASREANMPEKWLDGVKFNVDGEEFSKAIDFSEASVVKVTVPDDVRQLGAQMGSLRFPNEYPPTGNVDNTLAMMDEQFRSASHQRSNEGVMPKNIPGVSVEAQFAIDKMDITPQLQLVQSAIFEMVSIAWQVMKYVYTSGQRFRYSGGADELEDAVWMQEIAGDELDLMLKTRIGQPLTRQAKLNEIQGKIALAKAATDAGLDIGELLEAQNMDDFAFSFRQEDQEYQFAKYRLLYLTKGVNPPPVVDLANLPLHLAVIAYEVKSKRYSKYDKDVQDRLQKELQILALMMKQKEAVEVAAPPEEMPEPPPAGDAEPAQPPQ